MKNTFLFSIVLAIAFAASGCCSMCKQGSMGGKCPVCGMTKMESSKPMAEINTAALKALIDSNVPLTLVDARTGKYDDGRRIMNALNLSPEATDDEITRMMQSKDATIVSYCANLKCPASRMLAAKLMSLGYKHVLEYPQGIEGWVAEGNPVTQVTK
jgi:rhodanese-related sulfurtransferase